MATKNTIAVSESTKANLLELAARLGKTQTDTIAWLVSQTLAQIATTPATPAQKLQAIWLAVQEHNAKEAKANAKDLGLADFVSIRSAAFVEKHTGMNRSRDISPFIKSIEAEISEHENKVCKGLVTMSQHVQPKGQPSKIFAEILERAGVPMQYRGGKEGDK